MNTIRFKDAYRMYWTVFAKMLGEENVQFTFYRHGGYYLESRLGQTPIAEVDIWCGEKRDFTAHEVFPLLIQYFAQISCDASAHAFGLLQLDSDDQFRDEQPEPEINGADIELDRMHADAPSPYDQ